MTALELNCDNEKDGNHKRSSREVPQGQQFSVPYMK